MPAVSWTTIPPAKSFTPLTKSEPSAPDKRPPPQIQCVTGAYTKIIQSDEKNNTKEKETLSTYAPTIRAGVIIANVIWKAKNKTSGIVPNKVSGVIL